MKRGLTELPAVPNLLVKDVGPVVCFPRLFLSHDIRKEASAGGAHDGEAIRSSAELESTGGMVALGRAKPSAEDDAEPEWSIVVGLAMIVDLEGVFDALEDVPSWSRRRGAGCRAWQ